MIASEKCQQEKRKTVNGEDILFAMTSLGFENYAEALKIYLSKYREAQTARGENPNQPSDSYVAGGDASGQGNNLVTPGALDEHDSSAYGYPSVVPGHNGAGGESF